MLAFGKMKWALALSLGLSMLAPMKAVPAEADDDPLPAGAALRLGSRRYRHEGETFSLAFSPDKKILAAGASDGKVYLWETNTGKLIRRLEIGSFHACYPGIAFSPEGERLAVTGYGGLSMWDVAKGERLARYDVAAGLGYGRSAAPILFSPDGKRIYVPTGANEKKAGVTVIDTAADGKLRLIGLTKDRIDSFALSADGKMLALGLHDAELRGNNVVRLLDVAADKIVHEFRASKPTSYMILTVAFSPDGKTVAWTDKGRILLGDVKTGEQVGTLGPSGSQLLFLPDGKTLLSNGPDGKIFFWDITRRKRLRELDGRLWGERCLALSRDGQLVAVGDSGCTIRVWDTKSGRDLGAPYPGHDSVVATLAFSPDGKSLLSGDPHEQVRLWDTTSGQPRRSWRTGGGALTFSHDGKRFATACKNAWPRWAAEVDPVAHVWEVATGKELFKLLSETGHQVSALSFALDNETLIATTARTDSGVPSPRNMSLHFWDVATGRRLPTPTPLAGAIAAEGILSADGRTLASGLTPIRICSLQEGRQTRVLPGPKRWRLLALSADGKLLAARTFEDGPFQPDWENAIYVWETATGKEVLRRPLEGGLSLAFSPDGRFAAAAPDGWATHRVANRDTSFRICLYDLASGKEVRQFRPDGSHVASLAFSPDGSCLASGLGNGTALLWDVSTAIPATRATRQLSAKELSQLWADLASDDARKAYQAIWSLADHPRRTVPYLRERISPVVAETPHLAQLIAQLDDEQFQTRERATAELEKLLDAAEPALRDALRKKPTLEMRRRIEQLLVKLQGPSLASDRLRTLRAVTVLEQVGDADARQFLSRLAKGQPDVSLTREAQAALDRLTASGRLRPGASSR